MSVREFNTAARTAVVRDDGDQPLPVTVKVDGREVTFQPATEGQIALILAALSDTSGTLNGIATIINFFFSLLDPSKLESEDEDDDEALERVRAQLDSDVRYFKLRLLDHDDPFDGGDICDIVIHLIEQWTGNPTKKPSDFMQSQKHGGPRSTAKRRSTASTTR
jgi:hypothetical protein